MKINSRGQLIELINKDSLETFPVETDGDKKVLNTIIFNKKNNEFYRIVWGEVKDENNVYYLWYNEEVEKVVLDKSSGTWFTKDEKKKSIEDNNENTIESSIKQFALYNVKDKLVFINGMYADSKELDTVEVIAGRTASGKSEHVLREVVKAIEKDQSVLLFSTENNAKEVVGRLIRIIAPEAYRKLERGLDMTPEDTKQIEDAQDFLSKSKLVIDNNYLVDDNYILDKMEEVSNSENGLDLAIIDFLQLSPGNVNHKSIIGIHEKVDIYRQKLGCKVIITTQLARSFSPG